LDVALTDIFLKTRKSLMWSVMRIVRDPQAAEDVTQETYMRAQKVIEARPIEHIEGLLYQTARNLALDHQRRKKVRDKYEAGDIAKEDIEKIALDAPSAEDGLMERQRQALYEEALRDLPIRARTAWALSQLEGWTYARIAGHLGVSRNTVYNDIKLVMGHCRDALARIEQG
jgi:RNA polymerase sigma factor (sigma-70 family)